MSSKRFAGEVIWGSCALGFNETCFGFCVFAGCAGLVKLICKENKEQRGKRKFHEGAPHPNDRGGFTQWFGSCSLINTLYVWFPPSWAPMVAERLFGLSSNPGELSNILSMGSLLEGFPKISPGGILHQPGQETAGPSGTTTEVEH